MPETDGNYRLLVRLCRAAHSGESLGEVFRQTAEGLGAVLGCGRVGLVLAPGVVPGLAGLVTDADAPAGCRELPTGGQAAAVPQGLLRRQAPGIIHRPELGEAAAGHQGLLSPGHESLLSLPLLCRGEMMGALTLAGSDTDEVGRWDRTFLGDLAGLLALVLDGAAAHARLGEAERARREAAYLRDEARAGRDLRPLTGEGPAMRALRQAIGQVARTDSTVLITGETGTGKELVARAIHQLSPRRDRLLVAVNCAALAPGLVASELFGHEPGAFTGATRRRPGRFEVAHQGTIFLDEVGELPAEVQVMLLRVLQERVLERVGGHEPVPVDVRVVAATHRDLGAAMAEGRFRPDLYYRVNVFPVHVPPLRERQEDIPDLVRHFLHHLGRRLNKSVAPVGPAVWRVLQDYHWPGNVRELENIVERALIVAGDTLEIDPRWLRPGPDAAAPPAEGPPGLAELERQAILDALQRSKGKIYGPGGAAAALGLKPTTLYGKLRKHRIARNHDAG
jgi:formate hydrogenlyase transcriptional activator